MALNKEKLSLLKTLSKETLQLRLNKTAKVTFGVVTKSLFFYGADLSFQSKTMHVLNDTGIYQHIPEASQEDIPGVTTPYAYVGQTGSFFPLHKVSILLSMLDY